MLLPAPFCPLCPFSAARIASLRLTVLLLLTLLIKSRIQIKAASTLGLTLLALQTLLFLAAAGALGVAALAGLAVSLNRGQTRTV